MITKTGEGSAKTAFRKKLPKDKQFTFSFPYEAYADIAEVHAVRAYPSDADVLKWLNDALMATAKSKQLQIELKARGYVQPTAENDPQVGLQTIFKMLQTAKLPDGSRKYTDEQARETAAEQMGVDWADED